MKKTLKQLTSGDTVYMVCVGETKPFERQINDVYNDRFTIKLQDQRYNYDVERKDVFNIQKHDIVMFSNKPDSIRYAKSNLMKKLFKLIDNAKKDIEELKNYRLEHFELLNHDWTEKQINLLEQQIKQ